jgi:hypothetical protein
MSDLQTAKKLLFEKKLTLVIVKNGQVLFETDSPRISGFMKAIDSMKDELKGASVADRVVGKAIALLCVYSGITEVYAEVLSKKAKTMFEQYSISCEWKEIVNNVLDLTKTDMCPLEKVAAGIANPKESYGAFKAMQEKMKSCKS